MTGKLEGFLAPCERARPTNSLSWPRPLFLNHETHERKENDLLLLGISSVWFVLLFLSLPIRSGRWVQFKLELTVIRKRVAPVAVAAKARIADDEGGLWI